MIFIPKYSSLKFEGYQRPIYLDALLLVAAVGLLAIGYIMVTSASLHLGEKMAGDSFYYPKRQLLHIVLGLFVAGVVVHTPLKIWQKTAPWLFLLGIALLVLVLIPGIGIKVNGSVRWLSIAGVRIQASELFKLIVVIFMANYISRHPDKVQGSVFSLLVRHGWGSIPMCLFSPFGLLALGCCLLLMEPDFGSAVVVVLITMVMLLLAGARIGIFVTLGLILAILAGTLVYESSYRLKRLIAFLDPWQDPLASGYQLIQALIAFGRGEWLGVGLGSSVQKLYYLPEAHTDFLFSILGEELGLIGVVAVIVLFALLIWRAFLIGHEAMKAERTFSAYLAYGLAVWFGFQAFVNMGVNLGMLPTKGLTLPLMSYGGGSIVVMCTALALLFRIHSEVVAMYLEGLQRNKGWTGAS